MKNNSLMISVTYDSNSKAVNRKWALSYIIPLLFAVAVRSPRYLQAQGLCLWTCTSHLMRQA